MLFYPMRSRSLLAMFAAIGFFAVISTLFAAPPAVRFVTPSVSSPTTLPIAVPAVLPDPAMLPPASLSSPGNPLRPAETTVPTLRVPPCPTGTSPITSSPAAVEARDLSPSLDFTPIHAEPRPFTTFSPNSQPSPSSAISEQAVIESILREATALEQERRWPEVCKFYDEALQIHRNNPVLLERHSLARHHYDIVRRYYDGSFIGLLLKAGLQDNLVLFDEVTTKIQTKHIDAPPWSDLFRFGLKNLEIAFTEPVFLKTNGLESRQDRIAAFLRKVHEVSDGWSISNREEMRNGVLHVAQMAQQELDISPVAILLEFMCGVANSLDPYTEFLTRNQTNDQYSMIDGNYVGLGVELDSDQHSLYIARVISGSPAKEAGLVNGDRILAVNGHSTIGLAMHRAADLLQGEEKSVARLLVQTKSDPPRTVDVTRRRISVPSVEDARMLDETVGYFRLTCFQSTTTEEVRESLWKLHQMGMRSLVIDLRHNPGGLMLVAVDVANMFIDKGTIMSTRVHPQDPGTPYVATADGTWRIPLVVLLDRNSASASEIFAGAIRDHRRGVIVGSRSYGKGTVQTVYRLDGAGKDIAGLKITVEKYYSPSGRSCSGVGIMPDIEVNDLQQAPEVQLVAKPINGTVPSTGIAPLYQVPQLRLPSSAMSDPCIAQALATSRQLLLDTVATQSARISDPSPWQTLDLSPTAGR